MTRSTVWLVMAAGLALAGCESKPATGPVDTASYPEQVEGRTAITASDKGAADSRTKIKASPALSDDAARAPRGDDRTTRTADAATTAAAATPTYTPIPLPPGATPIPPLITPITGTPTEADLRAQDVANRARLALEKARQMDLRRELERAKNQGGTTGTATKDQ